MEIEAGRTYRVLDEHGTNRECAAAIPSEEYPDWPFKVGQWFLQKNGHVVSGWRVELVDLPDAGDAPDVSAVPLEERQVLALERIAAALEALVGTDEEDVK